MTRTIYIMSKAGNDDRIVRFEVLKETPKTFSIDYSTRFNVRGYLPVNHTIRRKDYEIFDTEQDAQQFCLTRLRNREQQLVRHLEFVQRAIGTVEAQIAQAEPPAAIAKTEGG